MIFHTDLIEFFGNYPGIKCTKDSANLYDIVDLTNTWKKTLHVAFPKITIQNTR